MGPVELCITETRLVNKRKNILATARQCGILSGSSEHCVRQCAEPVVPGSIKRFPVKTVSQRPHENGCPAIAAGRVQWTTRVTGNLFGRASLPNLPTPQHSQSSSTRDSFSRSTLSREGRSKKPGETRLTAALPRGTLLLLPRVPSL